MNARNLFRYEPIALGILRIMTGLLFMEHGMQKFLSFPPGEMAGFGWTFSGPAAYAGIIELLCGILVALGWFTRPAAFLASGTMAYAYWSVHRRRTSSRSTIWATRRSFTASSSSIWSSGGREH